MAIDLSPVPSIPTVIREAALTGRLVPFVGAGASRLAGCPGWTGFADQALNQLIEAGKLTPSGLDQVNGLSPRVKLSIAKSIAADAKTTIDYDRILHSTSRTENAEGRRLYKNIFALGNVFVTTNYDRWLDDRIAEPTVAVIPVASPHIPTASTRMNSIYKVSELLPDALTQSNTVIHLHGSVEDPDSMVLTTRDYVERYANDRRSRPADGENRVLTFLEQLFAYYTVLFIGYGLEELEILEYVIQKAKPRRKHPSMDEPRHFILQGFHRGQDTLANHMDAYYRHECGVQLMGFLREEKDHKQLLNVLEKYAQDIPTSAPSALVKEQVLEDLAREMESP